MRPSRLAARSACISVRARVAIKFDAIYGAEVAESQDTINYSRGVLYWLGQPLFLTGFRLNAELTSQLSIRALLLNGWNDTVDNVTTN